MKTAGCVAYSKTGVAIPVCRLGTVSGACEFKVFDMNAVGRAPGRDLLNGQLLVGRERPEILSASCFDE